ncbi:hypothetical protein [Roseateles sp.]|uniref:hypothetical protein n=1 Tax=Roseateles sp. TaxID=1971397 RepID=UPI00286B743B|nr:hypothetical protein [Roseateles sp.]
MPCFSLLEKHLRSQILALVTYILELATASLTNGWGHRVCGACIEITRKFNFIEANFFVQRQLGQ